MEFGEVPLAQAKGAILAHSVALPQGRLRKGMTLGAAEVAALHAARITAVTVARLGADDLHEDAAAQALARALVPDPAAAGLELRVMGTGRVNFMATRAGIVDLTVPQIHALNAVHPMITLATLPPLQRVAVGEMVATVKIIAYGVPAAAVAGACAAGASLAVRGVVRPRVALVQTVVGDEDGQKGQRVTQTRVARLGGTLAPLHLVAHQIAPLAQALRATAADVILILTASATSDAADTAPAALRMAGGRLIHFGMPVDPGNLLFLGDLAGVPVIGLPGCAKSPALNGADWVLERVMCGLDVTPADIAAMGVGGLLKEIPTRPRPRDHGPQI
jgi:molybdenum cofactor cytidylyltransferase